MQWHPSVLDRLDLSIAQDLLEPTAFHGVHIKFSLLLCSGHPSQGCKSETKRSPTDASGSPLILGFLIRVDLSMANDFLPVLTLV